MSEGVTDSNLAVLQQAAAFCDLKRYADAQAKLATILAADTENVQAWCLSARALLGLNQRQEALRAARRASSIGPEEEWPHRLASVALGGLGRGGEAVGEAQEAVRLAPHEWRAQQQLAQALLGAKLDLGEARQAAAQAVTLAPSEAGPHIITGKVAIATGDRPGAQASLRRALAIDPQNSIAHHELARAGGPRGRMGGFNPGRLGSSARGYATALRIDPSSQASRRNFDGIVRLFIRRVAYFVFLDAFLVSRLSEHSSSTTSRILPIAILAVPLLFAARFIAALPRELRAYPLQTALKRDFLLTTLLETLAIGLLIASAIGPASARTGLATAAGVAALAGRLIQYGIRKSQA